MYQLFNKKNIIKYKRFSGIYYIRVGKWEYVGSAVNLYERLKGHTYDLRKNRHHNPFMQNLYNKYGSVKFKFSIVEYCVKKDLINRETFYFNHLQNRINHYPPVELRRDAWFCKRVSDGHKLSFTKGRVAPNKKIVYQYNLDGSFIQSFESAMKAGKELGIEFSAICANCRNKVYTAGGYRFSYVKEDSLPELFKVYNSIPVYQYTLDSIFVKQWRSKTEAAKKLRISNIPRAVKYNLTAGGYLWKSVKT